MVISHSTVSRTTSSTHWQHPLNAAREIIVEFGYVRPSGFEK